MIRWWVVELPAAVVAGRPRRALLLTLGRLGVGAQRGAVGRGLLGRGGGPCPTPVTGGGRTGDRAALATLGLLAWDGGALDRGRSRGDREGRAEPGEDQLHVRELGLVVGHQLSLSLASHLLQPADLQLRHVDLLRVEQRRVARVVLERDRRAVHLVGVPLVVHRVLEVEAVLGLDRRGRGGVGGDRGLPQNDVDQARIASELAQRLAGLGQERLAGLLLRDLPLHLRALLRGGARRLRHGRRGHGGDGEKAHHDEKHRKHKSLHEKLLCPIT